MAKFNFCITTGFDGFSPMGQDYHAADTAEDARAAIDNAIREFSDYSLEQDLGVTVSNIWERFFERGCAAPDASMWNFNLAVDGDGVCLSLIGMTQADFDRENADA